MTITFVVLAHGEPEAFQLIEKLLESKEDGDKLIVINDPVSEEYTKQLRQYPVNVINHKLAKDYSAHRNIALDRIKTDYCFYLDADEAPAEYLLKNLKKIIESQQYPDLLWLPRANIFQGAKPIHALLANWTLQGSTTDIPVVNWPDMQTRLFRTKRGIRFVGKLHERLKTDKTHRVAMMPPDGIYAIEHRKTIDKQIADNTRYNTEFSVEDNKGKTTEVLLTNG